MKRKSADWADKAAVLMLRRPWGVMPIARALRAAEKRGFKRAVKLLREEGSRDWTNHKWSRSEMADWLAGDAKPHE